MKLRSFVLAQVVMFHTAQWSPDGTQILIARMGNDQDRRGYVFDLGRNELNSVSSTRLGQLERAWTPARREPQVWEQRTASGQAVALGIQSSGRYRTLSRERWAEQPALSPNGKLVLYEGRDQPHDVRSSWIVVVDTSGSNPKRLHPGTDPSWSPDGRRIVFKTEINGVLHVATIAAGGGAAAVLTPGAHPAWSPDGRRIAYMVAGRARSDIWIMNANGSSRRCLTCSVRE